MKGWIREKWNAVKVAGKQKIFCVGANKTGTTSLWREFENLGFLVGRQKKAERLMPHYISGDFDPIIDYCRTAQVFQDVPFSLPGTFVQMDRAFPNSKFILSIRDSPEQWYQSITKFHSKLFGKGSLPTEDDLKNSDYIWKGWAWQSHRAVFKTPESEPYHKETLIQFYINHNQSVLDYFAQRPNDLLVINLGERGSYSRFLKFIDASSHRNDFPWENRTEQIVT